MTYHGEQGGLEAGVAIQRGNERRNIARQRSTSQINDATGDHRNTRVADQKQ